MIQTKQAVPALRPAATVVLVRERFETFQVYLLKRSVRSGFMGGTYVFPGGTLDGPDSEPAFWATHVDLSAAEVARRLGGGIESEACYAYGVAAIRETLEEAGVFLARRNTGQPADCERIATLRMAEALPPRWFMDLVQTENWVLQFSRLFRWTRWMTPEGMKRRYDTRFFLALMPEDQTCAPDQRETVDGLWVSPEAGLAGNLAGKIPLSPPTLITLHQLMAYPRLKDLMREAGTRQWGQALEPEMRVTAAGPVILEPWDPEWRRKTPPPDKAQLINRLLPVGEPISRIWLHEGLWRPVKS
ncbi:hypothetical protein KKG24_05295 [Patescibacteria group bacterium]|nr:hypothetical protein [Patescibacteria group bacterium]